MDLRRYSKFVRPVIHSVFGAFALLMANCMFENKSSFPEGGGSETTLSGRVVDASGAPVSGAAVRIRLQSDLPPNLYSDQPGEASLNPQAYSGPDGRYQVQGLAAGTYFVECRVARGLAGMVPADLRKDEDTVRLPDAVVRATGAIRGRIAGAADSSDPGLAAVCVYLLGIWKREVARDSNAHAFLITDVPAGEYTLRAQPAYPDDLSRWNVLEREHVNVQSGDTLDLDSLVLPQRAALHDPVYTRDSAAAAAFYLASLYSGEEPQPDWVRHHFAVTGNRITMFYDFQGSFHRVPANVLALDGLEYFNIMGKPDYNTPGLPDIRLEAAPELSRLPNLKYLYIQFYDLSGLPAWTGSFAALSSLGLTRLKAFPEWVYEIPSLVYLGLGDSIPTVPPGISKLKNLRGLGLWNQISIFPSELMSMPSLQGVSLRENRICTITAEEKAWMDRQDSILQAVEPDPLESTVKDTLKWEETQVCP
ncbi:MAG: carboxypeptidase regulatory-like domain-containing protein [Fibrobacteria bacterium]